MWGASIKFKVQTLKKFWELSRNWEVSFKFSIQKCASFLILHTFRLRCRHRF